VKALRLMKEREKKELADLYDIHQNLRKRLEEIDDVKMNTPCQNVAPHIINISIPGLKPEVMIHTLGEKDIFISTKSACSSKQKEESKVLDACGLDEKRKKSAVRISLSYDTTKEEISCFLEELKEAIQQLKEIMEKIIMQYDHILIRYEELVLTMIKQKKKIH